MRLRRQLIKPDSENGIQASFFSYIENFFSIKHPEAGCFFSIPNGVNKNPATRIIYKMTGLKAGVPDTFLPVAKNGYHGLFIEFKAEKGRLSDKQKEWIVILQRQGYKTVVCKSLSEAINELEKYFKEESKEKKNEKDITAVTPAQG